MSFAEQAQHLLACDQYLFDRLDGRDVPPATGALDVAEDSSWSEYRSLITNLEEAGERRERYLRGLTGDDFSRTVFDHRFESEVTVWWLIVRGNLDHEIHHRGQIATYLRLSRVIND